MTPHEEACLQVQRAIRAETEVYEIPPWMKKDEKDEKDEDTAHEGPAHHHRTSPLPSSLTEKDSTMRQVTTTDTALTLDDAASTAHITEVDALDMLEAHGVQTQVLDDKIQALSTWTAKHACGGFGSEWVDVVCRRNWIKAFLGY